MALTQESGPLVISGQQPSINGYTPDYNADTGPSLAWGGMGFIDPRVGYAPQAGTGQRALGFASGYIETLDAIPTTSANNNIAASAVPVAGTPLTLVSTTTSAVTQITTAVQGLASKLTIPAGTLVLDTTPGVFTTSGGSTSSIQWYNPASSLARAVRVVSAGNDGSGSFTVSGYDIYGYPMTEKLTGGSASTATGKKAFKFISSVTPAGTLSGSNVSVGTTNILGLPLRDTKWAHALIFVNSALITATTGWVVADTATPTSVTGDTRGTYAMQTAADNTISVQVMQVVTPFMISNQPLALFGSQA